MRLAEQYMQAFSQLAKESTTVLLPTNANSPASMVAQALSIFKQIGTGNGNGGAGGQELPVIKAATPSVVAKGTREGAHREGGRVANAVGAGAHKNNNHHSGGFSLQKA